MSATFTAEQASLLFTAQRLFIISQVVIFPLYYLPGLRDEKDARFPCSISWMTRKGSPRYATLLFWNLGWACMMLAYVQRALSSADPMFDWLKAIFTLQMYATGFVTVVLTPMKGPDVALGSTDALHCYAAMLYVADHVLANELILGVPLTSAYGAGFAVSSSLCGACQFLRAKDDLYAKRLYVRALARSQLLSYETFVYILESGFMLFENALFFIFLFGMTSGIQIQ